MRAFYLATSAINSLHDDLRVTELIEAIKKSAQVYISIFTIAELASTSDQDRRTALLRTAKTISGDYRPAAMPGDLLRRSLETVSVWAPDMDNSMGPKWDGLWVAFNDPTLMDQESFLETAQWKAEQEEWYHEMHERGRPLMQATLMKLPAQERAALLSRFSQLIRYYPPESQFMRETIAYIASRSGTATAVDKVLADRIVRHSEHWRFFLSSMVYGMYGRSIRTDRFGKDKNPGSIDAQQSIYLAICDVFVTADRLQRRMLRLKAMSRISPSFWRIRPINIILSERIRKSINMLTYILHDDKISHGGEL